MWEAGHVQVAGRFHIVPPAPKVELAQDIAMCAAEQVRGNSCARIHWCAQECVAVRKNAWVCKNAWLCAKLRECARMYACANFARSAGSHQSGYATASAS